ncbi:MAG: bifunctional 4-hydroxy-2-oxoglutarate aldolase/2-dehydro-3-deoxy-phosphogluconate aldolase [Elainella sp. Prado103]|nr:bifunctional 4-hydroxy-2-oxoglutarate aldolase/2-dehydro-3-deoxy-phosphogluconate aldolase [Elainella sp. Prado103]
MTPGSWLTLLQQQKGIAVIRASQIEVGVKMAQAVAAGGMRLIEVTWNSPDPAKLIHHLHQALPHCSIGAGTLLTLPEFQAAIDAGAEFLFSPHLDRAMIEGAVRQRVPVIPGALSPTEIVTAWQAGATCVKVFPIDAVGGAAYIRHLQGPLGQIPLIPTGGVTLENASQFIQAGAVAVGLSGQLFPQQAIRSGDWQIIRDRAAQLMQQLTQAQP